MRWTRRSFHEAGFTVVYQDVILADHLRDVVAMFGDVPVRVVVLCPYPDVVERRKAGRGKGGYGDWPVENLDRILREETPRLGHWLDSSLLSVEETVNRILALG